MSFKPTAEQEKALELFATGKSLAIEAGAGAGKTSTLKLLSESTDRFGQYIAFNRPIVKEAGAKMPSTVNCSTAHSLAYKAVGHKYQARLRNSQRMRSPQIAQMLGLTSMTVKTFDGRDKTLSASFLAGLTMRAVTAFCQSADLEPSAKHVPTVEGLDPAGFDGRRAMLNRDVARHVAPAVTKAWADLMSAEGGLPFKHDHYLKAWHLSGPKIDADYIMFDEAQDANPVLVAIVAAQEHAQLVWVGDSQQQIYSFTGAVNALASVPAEQRTYLTQSFRFGPAVAAVANSVLDKLDAELRIVGTPSIPSRVGPTSSPDAILTRTNAAAVKAVLEAQRAGRKVHLVGGGGEVVKFAKAAQMLMDGRTVEHPELACFATWNEVCEYVEDDEQGGELRLLVNLVTEFEVPTILAALDSEIEESDADLIVSTAHKSKGREWDSVRIGGDFPAEVKNPEEWRLLYVAATRARLTLDVSACGLLSDGVTETPEPVEAPVEVAASNCKPGHVGTPGERVDLTLTVKGVNEKEINGYTKFITTLADASGNSFKWFGSFKLDTGKTYTGEWMIKGHGEFRGAKETVLSHPAGIKR